MAAALDVKPGSHLLGHGGTDEPGVADLWNIEDLLDGAGCGGSTASALEASEAWMVPSMVETSADSELGDTMWASAVAAAASAGAIPEPAAAPAAAAAAAAAAATPAAKAMALRLPPPPSLLLFSPTSNSSCTPYTAPPAHSRSPSGDLWDIVPPLDNGGGSTSATPARSLLPLDLGLVGGSPSLSLLNFASKQLLLTPGGLSGGQAPLPLLPGVNPASGGGGASSSITYQATWPPAAPRPSSGCLPQQRLPTMPPRGLSYSALEGLLNRSSGDFQLVSPALDLKARGSLNTPGASGARGESPPGSKSDLNSWGNPDVPSIPVLLQAAQGAKRLRADCADGSGGSSDVTAGLDHALQCDSSGDTPPGSSDPRPCAGGSLGGAGSDDGEEDAADDDFYGQPASRRRAASVSQSTKPRSVAERVRRERISVRLQRLKEVMPKSHARVDTSAMLEDAVAYIRSLQGRVKALEAQVQHNTATMASFSIA